MLEGVLGPGGTASEAAIPGYKLAGKTGTAEVFDTSPASTRSRSTSRRSSALRRRNDPQLLVSVVVNQPQGEIYGGKVAAPAFQEILNFALPVPEDPAELVRNGRQISCVAMDLGN